MDQIGPKPVAYEWRSAAGCRSWPRPLRGAYLIPPALLVVADLARAQNHWASRPAQYGSGLILSYELQQQTCQGSVEILKFSL